MKKLTAFLLGSLLLFTGCPSQSPSPTSGGKTPESPPGVLETGGRPADPAPGTDATERPGIITSTGDIRAKTFEKVVQFTVKDYRDRHTWVDVIVEGKRNGDAVDCRFIRTGRGFRMDMTPLKWGGLPMAMSSLGYDYGVVAPLFDQTLLFYQKDTENFGFRVDFVAGNKIFRSLNRVVTKAITDNDGTRCTVHAQICTNLQERIGDLEQGKPTYDCRGNWNQLVQLEAEVNGLEYIAGLQGYLKKLNLTMVRLNSDGHPHGDPFVESITSFDVPR